MKIRAAAVIGCTLFIGGAATAHAAVSHHPAPRHAAAPAGAAPVEGTSENAYLTAVLQDLGDRVTRADLATMADWMLRESTWPTGTRWPGAKFNPFNTTLPEPGSTAFNSDRVQNYTTAAQGARATADTISNGNYPHIAAALAAGTGLCSLPAAAADFLTWSNHAYGSPVCPS